MYELHNQVIEYLTKYFNQPEQISEQILDEHFITKFGVNVSGDSAGTKRFLFNYDMISVKWTFPLCQECRGMIVEFKEGKWYVVSWPYNKFFNFTEPNCPISKADYETSPTLYRLLSKEDGTYISVYFYDGRWCVSTRGTITTMEVNGSGMTFEDLFWDTAQKTAGVSHNDFQNRLVAGNTYIFELCTPLNRIVSLYPKPTIYLIGLRELKYGRLMTHGELDEFAAVLGVPRPKFLFCNDLLTVEALHAFVELDSTQINPGDPEYKEGFVMYDGCKPVAKLKNKKYLMLHSIMGGHDQLYTIKSIARCFFSGTLDDAYAALPDALKKGADALKREVENIRIKLMHVTNEIAEKYDAASYTDPKEAQKQYALLVTKLVPAAVGLYSKFACGYFFMNKALIIEGKFGDFTKYLMDSCEQQLDYWKGVIKIETVKS